MESTKTMGIDSVVRRRTVQCVGINNILGSGAPVNETKGWKGGGGATQHVASEEGWMTTAKGQEGWSKINSWPVQNIDLNQIVKQVILKFYKINVRFAKSSKK